MAHLKKKELFLNCLTLEDKGILVLQYTRHHSPSNVMSHPGSPEFRE